MQRRVSRNFKCKYLIPRASISLLSFDLMKAINHVVGTLFNAVPVWFLNLFILPIYYVGYKNIDSSVGGALSLWG